GRADFTGRVGWSSGGMTSDGRLVLAGVDFQSSAGMVRQARGDLAFNSLLPIALQPNQTITIAKVELFVPLDNVSARLSYAPEAFRLEAATADFAQGHIALDPITYHFGPGAVTQGTLRLQNVDLAPLLAAVGLANRVTT